jgi:large subunit ribosomal protein L29
MKQSEIKDLSVSCKKSSQLRTYADPKMAHAISPIENPLKLEV